MGVFAYNACWLLLAIPPSIVWLRGFPSDVGKRRRLLVGVLAALGMLGFVFSVLTPDDDLVQQEFTQSQKSSLQSPSKAANSDLNGRVHAVYLDSAHALPDARSKVIEGVSPLPEKCAELIFSHSPGDRSPPVLS